MGDVVVVDVRLERAFLDYMTEEVGHSPRTARTYKQGIERLETFCAKSVENITTDDGRRFLRETDYARSTKNGTIAAWKAIHRFGALEGEWGLNGILAVRVPKQRRKRGPSLPFADVPAVLQECRLPTEFRIIYLGLYAGLRNREATFVRREHWQDGWILVAEGKGGKERRVPVHPELEKHRLIILASSPIGAVTLQNACQRVRARTGVHFTSHWLRRSFSRKLESLETDHEVIRELLGHAGDITSHYAGVSERRMMESVNRINYLEVA